MPSKSKYVDTDVEDEEYLLLKTPYEPFEEGPLHPDDETDAYIHENPPSRHSRYQHTRSTRNSFRFHFLRPILLRLRRFLLPPGIARFLLPSSSHHPPHYFPFPRVAAGRKTRFRVYSLVLLAFLVVGPAFLLILLLLYGGIPPSYADARMRERQLSQHHWEKIIPENSMLAAPGKVREPVERYVRFPDHLWGHGLNNVLQEVMLYALIAHQSKRSFVFEDYVWSHLPLPYTIYDFALRPTRVPMSAFLGGWIVGLPGTDVKDSSGNDVLPDEGDGSVVTYPDKDHRETGAEALEKEGVDISRKFSRDEKQQSSLPSTSSNSLAGHPLLSTLQDAFHSSLLHRRLSRSLNYGNTRLNDGSTPSGLPVSAEYFEHVCPPRKRVEISYDYGSDSEGDRTQTASLPPLGGDADGPEILQWWVNRLSQDDVKDEQCVVVKETKHKVWDPNFFGTTRILALFPLLRDSPVLQDFQWSPLVRNAVERSIGVLFGPLSSGGPTTGQVEPGTAHPSAPVTNALSHGTNFISGVLAACTRLANWGSGYMGWNRLVDGNDFEEGLQRFIVEGDDAASHNSGTDPVDHKARKEAYYLAHCLPTIPTIVHRLGEIRKSYETSTINDRKPTRLAHHLSQVYILTNGWPSSLFGGDHIGAHRSKMAGSAGLNKEEKGVSAAIDMAIASALSLSANIVLLRMAKVSPDHSNWML
ncbi:hypothetical protein CPB84DRAFT_1787382 [Gymnopilus junonius]|uniref:Transmembrane protein n=1 Tax=Gymnopilus junonius TaxID=109634 RepID=A0A9P5TKR8_GYMJU|nr:hypothetical protein CPB84DRAFT_1787382 [Gymnopilus junonius]